MPLDYVVPIALLLLAIVAGTLLILNRKGGS
jgi:hypothetical protein